MIFFRPKRIKLAKMRILSSGILNSLIILLLTNEAKFVVR